MFADVGALQKQDLACPHRRRRGQKHVIVERCEETPRLSGQRTTAWRSPGFWNERRSRDVTRIAVREMAPGPSHRVFDASSRAAALARFAASRNGTVHREASLTVLAAKSSMDIMRARWLGKRRLLTELPPAHRWSDGKRRFRRRAQTRRFGPGDWAWRPCEPISSNLSNCYQQPTPLRLSTTVG